MRKYIVVLDLIRENKSDKKVREYLIAWNNETTLMGTSLERENARAYTKEQAETKAKEIGEGLIGIYKVKAIQR